MMDRGMKSYWKDLYTVFLAVLMGEQSLGAGVQISWPGEVTAGFKTTFTCSSACSPNCVYTWAFKGRTVSGSVLTWTPDGLDQTVELQCSVLSPQTGASISMTSIVDIKNRVSVKIGPPNTVPSLNNSLDLFCHDATLDNIPDPSHLVNEVVWYKDGQKVIPNENVQQNNLTLHFDLLLTSDAGFYQCETYLPALRQGRVFSLGFLLSYDPWNVTVSGPDIVFTGEISVFTCLTSCTLNVDCTVKWQFRSGFPFGNYLSVRANELRWTPSRPGSFQTFTCVAENAAAGRSAEATKMVQVEGIPLSGAEMPKLNGVFVLTLRLGLTVLFGV